MKVAVDVLANITQFGRYPT